MGIHTEEGKTKGRLGIKDWTFTHPASQNLIRWNNTVLYFQARWLWFLNYLPLKIFSTYCGTGPSCLLFFSWHLLASAGHPVYDFWYLVRHSFLQRTVFQPMHQYIAFQGPSPLQLQLALLILPSAPSCWIHTQPYNVQHWQPWPVIAAINRQPWPVIVAGTGVGLIWHNSVTRYCIFSFLSRWFALSIYTEITTKYNFQASLTCLSPYFHRPELGIACV